MKTNDQTAINNAGIVVLAPYLAMLFHKLGYLEGRAAFKTPHMQMRAMALLQYILHENTELSEPDISLYRIFAGIPSVTVIAPEAINLADNEISECQKMLKAALNNWPRMKNSIPEALRIAFLRRPGTLTHYDDSISLVVEPKAHDMLLNALPWNYSIIKYKWMEKPLLTKWEYAR